ncbi:zinc finger, CCHC-type containing protein [Tanacetum coccineum]
MEQGTDSAWSKLQERSSIMRCYICQSEEHLKRDCPKYNHKKSQGFVRNEDRVSGSEADEYDNIDVMMAMSVEEMLDWIMDSGGSYHIIYRIDYLVDLEEYDSGNILIGDGRECRIRGDMYVRELSRNLISLGTLEKEGFTVKMQSGKIKVIKDSLVVLSGTRRANCVYTLDGQAVTRKTLKGRKQLGEYQIGWKIKMGNVLDFCNQRSTQQCTKSGVAKHLGVAGLQQQNGLVEEINVTLLALIQSGLSKTPIDMLGLFGLLASFKQGMLVPIKVKCIFLGYREGIVANKLWKLDGVTSKVVLYRNLGFNESGEYKITFISSGVDKGSIQVLQEVEFEVEPQEDHAFEVEPLRNVGQRAGSQEVQTQDLIYYHSTRDREQHSTHELFRYREDSNEAAFAVVEAEMIYAHESLTFNNTIACEVISKWKAELKEDMDARSDVYVLSNGCRKSSNGRNDYYWEYTPGMFIHLFLYIDDMVFSCGCKAEIWVTKGLLDKAKRNVLGIKIIRDQSGNTLRVSQSRFYNRKLVQTLLEGRFILSMEGSLSRDCDVEKNGKWSYTYAVESQVYQGVCTRPDIASADVGMYDRMLHMMALLTTDEAGCMTFIKAWKKEAIWLRGLLEELGVELNRVAVNCDNQGAIPLSRNHVFHEWNKHIIVRYHFIREVLEAKAVKVLKVGTEHNAADALTKVVPGHKLQHCLELLSVGLRSEVNRKPIPKCSLHCGDAMGVFGSLRVCLAKLDGVVAGGAGADAGADAGAVVVAVAIAGDVAGDVVGAGDAVWDCGSDKSPGPNGFTFKFLKKHWDLIQNDVFAFVKDFETSSFIPRGCNYSFITLVPKVDDPLVISLVVGDTQMAFIKGRQIIDGPMMVNEIITWAKKHKKRFLFLKVDFEKAFDSLSWSFLISIMGQVGFSIKWRTWIRACLESAFASVLVNGFPTKEFKLEKGLRQGDPLSPFLFILAMEAFSVAILEATNNNIFHGVKVGKDKINISHLQFADDALILGDWSLPNAKNLSRILTCFHLASCLKVNFNKSKLFGIRVTDNEINIVASSIG